MRQCGKTSDRKPSMIAVMVVVVVVVVVNVTRADRSRRVVPVASLLSKKDGVQAVVSPIVIMYTVSVL